MFLNLKSPKCQIWHSYRKWACKRKYENKGVFLRKDYQIGVILFDSSDQLNSLIKF